MSNDAVTISTQPVTNIVQNPNVLYTGMKLTDLYKSKNIFLFGEFKIADIDSDGIISEGELELYDKKNDIMKNAEYNSKTKFTKDEAIYGSGLLGMTILGYLVRNIKSIPLSIGLGLSGLIAIGLVLYAIGKEGKRSNNVIKKAKEECIKLEEEYRQKLNEQKNGIQTQNSINIPK